MKLEPIIQSEVSQKDKEHYTDNNENLQEICKAETLVQARKRKQTNIENRVRGNLESMFLQCPKPTLQQISRIAQQLRLEKDDFEAAGSPFTGRPLYFPLTPGPHFGTTGYGGPHFTTLYSLVPFPDGEAFPSVSVIALDSPMHSN
ncbi:hypothetical protein FD755_001201 [Muntiacus reevesi]|uniref:Homeobox domain-containing protein n=1 Tax=Muntiacus reevesi TaxID=9886 RepID=A0A5J5N108_MUNRE|nr:hypothetical protein FD755_001201 [Muntiacus reevesi]